MSRKGPLVIVGDLLLDREVIGAVERLCPEAPVPVLAESSAIDRPGGAGLAALFACGDDNPGRAGARHEVILIAAVSADEAGERLRELLAEAGIRLVALPLDGPTPEKIRMRAGEHLLLRLDRGDRLSPVGPASREARAAIAAAGAILVSDYGRGVAGRPELQAALAERAHRAPVVWDPHPRGGDPVAGVHLVTPNRAEAAAFAAGARRAERAGWGPANPDPAAIRPASGDEAGLGVAAAQAALLRRHWAASAVAVTLGGQGAVLAHGARAPLVVPASFAAHGDPCGAGDRFASAATAVLAEGGTPFDAVATAVTAATAYVAAGGALSLLPGNAGQGMPGSPIDLLPRRREPGRGACDVMAGVRRPEC